MASVESYTPCLLGAMDRLWFQKVVLISEPSSSTKTPITKNSPTSSPKSHTTQSSSSLSSAPNSDNCSDDDDDDDDDVVEDVSHGATTASTSPKSDSKHEDEDDDVDDKKEEKREENMKGVVRPTRARASTLLSMKKIRQSSVPIRRRTRTRIRLERTRSSKSSAELEEEEVKGFMDLGFVFDKERITPKMMSMIPGLQRLEGQDEEGEAAAAAAGEGEEIRRRPYLSEAWKIEREESPIVMVRMPIVNAAANDMKKHLKLWAKTVAFSAVQHA